MFGEGMSMDDLPAGQAEDREFHVEVGFHELEIVAYVGELKIVGAAHFGITGRASSQRSSDYLRHFADTRLTLSKVRIFKIASNELVDTAAFVVLNLDRVDLVYARDPAAATDASEPDAAEASPKK